MSTDLNAVAALVADRLRGRDDEEVDTCLQENADDWVDENIEEDELLTLLDEYATPARCRSIEPYVALGDTRKIKFDKGIQPVIVSMMKGALVSVLCQMIREKL